MDYEGGGKKLPKRLFEDGLSQKPKKLARSAYSQQLTDDLVTPSFHATPSTPPIQRGASSTQMTLATVEWEKLKRENHLSYEKVISLKQKNGANANNDGHSHLHSGGCRSTELCPEAAAKRCAGGSRKGVKAEEEDKLEL